MKKPPVYCCELPTTVTITHTRIGSSSVHLNYRQRRVEDTNYLLSRVWHSAWKCQAQRTCCRCRPTLYIYTCNYNIHTKVGRVTAVSLGLCRVELQEARGLPAALDDVEPTNLGIMHTAPCRAAPHAN